jgi:hypothetical protein
VLRNNTICCQRRFRKMIPDYLSNPKARLNTDTVSICPCFLVSLLLLALRSAPASVSRCSRSLFPTSRMSRRSVSWPSAFWPATRVERRAGAGSPPSCPSDQRRACSSAAAPRNACACVTEGGLLELPCFQHSPSCDATVQRRASPPSGQLVGPLARQTQAAHPLGGS